MTRDSLIQFFQIGVSIVQSDNLKDIINNVNLECKSVIFPITKKKSIIFPKIMVQIFNYKMMHQQCAQFTFFNGFVCFVVKIFLKIIFSIFK